MSRPGQVRWRVVAGLPWLPLLVSECSAAEAAALEVVLAVYWPELTVLCRYRDGW